MAGDQRLVEDLSRISGGIVAGADLQATLSGVVAGMRDATTFYMIYVGLEDDGTFIGYYNDGFGPTGNVSYTYLDGGACAWNYTKACGENFPCDAAADTWLATTPACREFYVIDEVSGTPACANVTHGACGAFIDMRGCENASLKHPRLLSPA